MNKDDAVLRSLPQLMFAALTLLPVGSAHTASNDGGQPQPGPRYAEEADGTSAVWVQAGPSGWLTDHEPLAEFVPVSTTAGFSHQIGPGRLAWRVSLAETGGTDATRFLSLDFIGVERVYSTGLFNPFLGVAFGMSLDLKAQRLSIGDDGYFNKSNGATGGLAVTSLAGTDVRLTSRMFLRVEARVRAYGGAGRTGVVWTAQSGLGFDL